jgi:ECF transporter S component (folate family)
MKKTRVLVFMGLFISLEVILTRFIAIQTPIIRIGFGFVPIAISAIMFGPVIGGLTAVIADIIGMIIAPKGMYFPGLTFSAFMTGLIYGAYLHKKNNSIVKIFLAVLTITLIVDLGLNTVWLSILTGEAASAIIVPRLIKSSVMLPVQTVTIHAAWRYIERLIKNGVLRNVRMVDQK